MAVQNRAFEIAALAADKPAPDAEENVAELDHGNGYFSLWRRPSPGQFGMLQLRQSRGTSEERLRGLDRFFAALVLTPEEAVANERKDAEGRLYSERVEAGETAVGMDFFWDLWERDLIETDTLYSMMKEALEMHSGFPTSSQPASSPSASTSGPRSTATSRRARPKTPSS